ncbi:MAG: DUF1846 domain-containing protein [Candidatus Woesearchaeota archaeon]
MNYFLRANGIPATTYNRDMENFIVLRRLLSEIFGKDIYASPTEMGINFIKESITDDNTVRQASLEEIKRRFCIYRERSGLGKKDYEHFLWAKELVAKHKLAL